MVFNQMRKRMKIIVYIVVVALVAGGLYLGFGYFTGGNNNNVSPTATDQNVIARVNGEEITYNEFYNMLQNYQSTMASLPNWEVVPFQVQVLQALITRSMLLQEANEMGVKAEVSDEEVDKTLQNILDQNQLTMEELKTRLSAQNLTIQDVRDDIRASMKESQLLQNMVEQVRNDVEVTEEEIKAEYEKVHLHDIFVKFGNYENKDEALSRVQEALSKLEAGEDFATVASEYSESTSAEQGGDLGFISRKDYLDEKLLKAAFDLELNQVSEVIETDEGYHLIKVDEIVAAEGDAYEEKRVQIEEQLKQKKGQAHYYQWIDQVQAETEVDILNPVYSGFYNLKNENYAEALEDLLVAAEQNPDAAMLQSYLAEAYYNNGNEDKAIEVYQQAVLDFPEDAQLWFAFGELYRKMDQTDKAVEKYEKAGELAKDDYFMALQLMRTFQMLGMEEKAKIYEQRIEDIRKAYEEQQQQQQEQQQEQQQPEQQTQDTSGDNSPEETTNQDDGTEDSQSQGE
ncbi:MAG: SurA N-terminal domain-containing protein [Halanaerobium sp.]|nr:SurA N-terminal domain-containing protein [Halanaerobium sp.]